MKINRWLIGFNLMLLIVMISLSGCANNEVAPLPGSAKNFSPDLIPLALDQITIPFPFTEKFSNGIEQWILERDTSNHLVLRVRWITQEIAVFPVNTVGTNQVTGLITLGGKDYNAINLTLNSDNESGWITLQEK